MSIMSEQQLNGAIKAIRNNRTKLQEQIQETLISASYYAMKDGNVTPFSQLVEALGNSMHLKGVTMWAELFAPVLVREGKLTLNKTAMKTINVQDEDDFAPYEAEMRTAPKWYEIAGEQRVESIFSPFKYLDTVAKKLEKEGFPELAQSIRAAKGRAEMELIDAVEAIDVVPRLVVNG